MVPQAAFYQRQQLLCKGPKLACSYELLLKEYAAPCSLKRGVNATAVKSQMVLML